jgi:hypothetical protein
MTLTDMQFAGLCGLFFVIGWVSRSIATPRRPHFLTAWQVRQLVNELQDVEKMKSTANSPGQKAGPAVD